MLNQVAIIGTGLIGGSLALALRKNLPATKIIGIDRDKNNLADALHLGAIDAMAGYETVCAADIIVVAVPVRQFPVVLKEIAPYLQAHTVLTDVGSTKQDVVCEAQSTLGDKVQQFVPGHPIAGREHSGMAAAHADLFIDRTVVLTPLPSNMPMLIERVKKMWQHAGAQVAEMSAESHDCLFAAVSHLPHLLAFSLVDELANRDNAKTLFSYAASGFRDFTRIAGSSPEMWCDIALNNRTALVRELDHFLRHTQKLRDAIEAGDEKPIHALMQNAQEARQKWQAGEWDYFKDDKTC